MKFFQTTTFLIVCLITTICFTGISQSVSPSKVKDFLSLKDNVHILSFFVDTEQDSWEGEEIAHYYDELIKSQKWLVDQAANWDQELEFDNDYFNADNKSIVYIRRLTSKQSSRHTIRLIMDDLGYENIEAFLDDNNFDKSKEKLKIVLFVKSNDRSHAYNYWSVDDIDLAIIYCKSTFGMLTDQYVISHEMLHQFGAWDLYYEMGKIQTKESSIAAKTNYPHSVMINTFRKKELLEVDDVTAWRIGWTDWNEAYNIYDPKLNKKKIEKERKDTNRGNAIEFNIGKEKEE